MRPRQRLFPNLPDDACRNCAGRGFLIIEKLSQDGRILPNEVIECGVCDGKGKRKTN
jgi:excinuclease UvrABC ATPase subunit